MTSSEKILTELKWYKLEKRRHLHKATLMYKCLYKESEGVNVTFVRRMDRHNYNTGNRENFVLPKPKKNNLKRTFRYSSAQIWNLLPHDVKNADSLAAFKRSYINLN